MPRHRLSLPMSAWPEDILRRFEKAFADATRAQRPRLEQGLGRWLLAAEREEVPTELVTTALVNKRSEGMAPELASAMKQALFAVFEELSIFVPDLKVPRETERAALARNIARNIDRLPPDWKERAVPALVISEDGLSDGLIIDARAVSAVKRILETAWAFFDFCRSQALLADLTPRTFAARVDERQDQFRRQDPGASFSINTMLIEASCLLSLGRDLFPERDWRWLASFIERMKPRARLYPTRNDQRVVPLAELRAAAVQASEVALEAHARTKGYKARQRAHTLARTALAIQILISSPIRLTCLAKLDLHQHFDPGLTHLYLSAAETKDGKRDVRLIPPELRRALVTYLEVHRPLVAPDDEMALFVGRGGKRTSGPCLTERMGDLTETLFGRRVTAHVMRNVIAAFIVSEAPEEAALATEVLNHSDPCTTEAYRATGTQITASRKLAEASETRARAVGAKGAKSGASSRSPRRIAARPAPRRRSRA